MESCKVEDSKTQKCRTFNFIVIGSDIIDTDTLLTMYDETTQTKPHFKHWDPFEFVHFKHKMNDIEHKWNFWNIGGGFDKIKEYEKINDITQGLIIVRHTSEYNPCEDQLSSLIENYKYANPEKQVMIIYFKKNDDDLGPLTDIEGWRAVFQTYSYFFYYIQKDRGHFYKALSDVIGCWRERNWI